MNKRKERVKIAIRHTSTLIIVIALALTLYALTSQDTLSEEFSSKISAYGTPALFLISMILDLVPQLISPVVALGMAIVAGINIYLAITATAIGSAIGSIIGFAIGKKYMYEAVDILTEKKSTDKLTHLTNKYGKIIILLAAISPLPYLPVVIGAINLSKRNFIIYGLIPRAIGITGYGLLIGLI